MRYFKKIVGDQCYLSPINIEDAQKIAGWSNDLEVALNTGDASDMITIEKQREYLDYMSNNGYSFFIVSNTTDEAIGVCKLKNVDLINRKATLGIFIGEKSFWNTGIGTEATKLLLDFGFNIINLNNIMLEVYSFNKRAIKSYEKCGFKEIGRRRSSVLIGDREYDEVYMDILRKDFKGSIIDNYLK